MKTWSKGGNYVARMAVVLICLAVPAGAFADGLSDKKSKRGKSAPPVRSLQATEEILKRSTAFFAAPPFMLAEQVHEEAVLEGDRSYFLVSLQSPAEFAKGHVPGAVNIPFERITERKSLELMPRDRKIVFTCDDGHRSMMASLYVNQLGYSATTMPMGMSHWNRAASAEPYTGSAGHPMSNETVHAAPGKKPPVLATQVKGKELITERTRAVLAPGRKLFMDSSEVYGAAAKDVGKGLFLVSIQRPEDYTKGHVPGAVNIPFTELAKKETLGKLPTDRKIVVVCYIGHIGAAATLFLNQLGYEAYDLRFGTLGWNDTTEGLGKMSGMLLSLVQDMKYPLEGEKLSKK